LVWKRTSFRPASPRPPPEARPGSSPAPLPSFQKTDLTCLTDLPQLKCLQLSDIRLPDLTALHRVAPLTRLRLSGKRPAIDCERLPAVQMW
jgi:hypothetical protein